MCVHRSTLYDTADTHLCTCKKAAQTTNPVGARGERTRSGGRLVLVWGHHLGGRRARLVHVVDDASDRGLRHQMEAALIIRVLCVSDRAGLPVRVSTTTFCPPRSRSRFPPKPPADRAPRSGSSWGGWGRRCGAASACSCSSSAWLCSVQLSLAAVRC